jgi:hypothetical protein
VGLVCGSFYWRLAISQFHDYRHSRAPDMYDMPFLFMYDDTSESYGNC